MLEFSNRILKGKALADMDQLSARYQQNIEWIIRMIAHTSLQSPSPRYDEEKRLTF